MRESIREVMKTLVEAIVLVILVIFLFLQDWRATLIPAITIPVSLIGTFAFIKAFGFSINTLTLFGIVLATGLVVDDAIVVVENIERNLGETRGDARDAARRGHGRGGGRGGRDVAGADRGVRAGGVHLRHDRAALPAVLADHRLLGRHLGVQRADAVAGAGRAADAAAPRASERALRRCSAGSTGRSTPPARATGARSAGCWATCGWVGAARSSAGLALTLSGLPRACPSGFVPDEDQNYFIIQVIGPQGASLDYMTGIAKQVEAQLREPPEVQDIFSVLGFNFAGNGANRAIDLREPDADRGARRATRTRRRRWSATCSASCWRDPGRASSIPFLPPPIQGQGIDGRLHLRAARQGRRRATSPRWRRRASSSRGAGDAQRTGGRPVHHLQRRRPAARPVTIDREKAKSIGVPIEPDRRRARRLPRARST